MKTEIDWQQLLDQVVSGALTLGKSILIALVIYFVGRYLIKVVNKFIQKAMEKRKVDGAVRSFVGSLVNILLLILLFLSIVGALGIEMTSFAALLASAGVAVGMALSGNLQNFAGGLVLLVLRPYKVGDFIEIAGVSGVVKSVEIFNTVLTTGDNKVIFIPNNAIATGTLVNYSHQETRRVDFKFGVDYGTDYKKVKDVIERLIAEDSRILKDPAHFIGLGELADSSVNITVRVWVKSADYWDVFFNFTEKVYATFPKEGIEFPFPQMTIHQAK
jgi:small conductance mechanosensitive channel